MLAKLKPCFVNVTNEKTTWWWLTQNVIWEKGKKIEYINTYTKKTKPNKSQGISESIGLNVAERY